jgi:hypothetical protein
MEEGKDRERKAWGTRKKLIFGIVIFMFVSYQKF